MLLRGFGERRGKDFHIFVCQRNGRPFQKGTGNFGQEKYFYGPEGSETDNLITNIEGELQGHILRWREENDGTLVDPEMAARLVALLEIRSNFLRQHLSHLMDRLFQELAKHFGSPRILRDMARSYIKNDPSRIDKMLEEYGIPESMKGVARSAAEHVVDNADDGMLLRMFGGELHVLKAAAQQAPQMIKDSHNKAILEFNIDNKRVRSLAEMEFSVMHREGHQFILPDTCCASISKKGAMPFSQPNEEVHTVVVPISSNRALIGRRGPAEVYSLSTINRILAGCAYESIIANTASQELVSLSKRIGKFAKLIPDKELREILSVDRLMEL